MNDTLPPTSRSRKDDPPPEEKEPADVRYYHEHRSQGAPPPEELYRLLVDSVADYAIFALDRHGHILTWNVGAQRIKGYAPDEIIGKHFSIFYSAADREAHRPDRLLGIAAREGRYAEEGWRYRKDGTRFWASVVITALRNEAGELVGFGKVTRDLTERKIAEEALRESEERFRLLVQGARDYAMFMLDPEGRIVTWNEGAQRIKGYRAEEIIGRHFSIFYPVEDIAKGKPQHELEEAARLGSYEEEGWRYRKDGSKFWASVVITPMRRPSGELIGYAKLTRDLTERRAAEERALEDARRLATEEAARQAAEVRARELADLVQRVREQAEEVEARRLEAEQANRAKSQFLTTMSHELRTPLNAIAGYTQLLALGVHGPVTPEQLEALERIQRSEKHLLGLINDVLNFARLEAGRVEYRLADVSLADALESVRAMTEPQATEKGIVLQVEPVPPDLRVHADPEKLSQALLNLLSNAIKFTSKGGRIRISTTREGDKVLIRVADTGRGIPAEQAERIFEPFVQIDPALTRTAEGTGLGLSISRDLARGMGGDLRLERSVPGEGSTFLLTLRVA